MPTIDLSKVKGIIFDYGGTLDTGGDHWSYVIEDAYRKAGVFIDRGAFRDAYVFGERELARTLHILPHHTFADLMSIKIKIEMEELAAGNVVPSDFVETKAPLIADYCYKAAKESVEKAKPVLKELSKRYSLVLVSNFYGNIATVLKDFGIDGYFSKIVESAVVGVRKPDPRIFELGAEAMGLKPEETLVIGDSYRKDIVPAEKAGAQVLWIKGRGWTPEEDAQLHPNIISRLHDVLELVAGSEPDLKSVDAADVDPLSDAIQIEESSSLKPD